MIGKVLCVAIAAFFCFASAHQRITGGSPADVSQYPYVVSILYHSPSDNSYTARCAGSLLSSWHLLTSAFCFNNAQAPNFVVRGGSSNSLSGGVMSRLRGLLKHPGYVASPRQNDIALVYLQTPFSTSTLISALPLPPQDHFLSVGTEGWIAGWGYNKEGFQGGVQQQSLQTASLHKVSQDSCAAVFANVSDVAVSDTVFCFARENSSYCSGDLGAPLKTFIYSGEVLIGLFSYYKDCGSSAYPDIFTRVDRYTNWILENAVTP